MRVDPGEEEREDFSNTRPDVTKVITEGLPLSPVATRSSRTAHIGGTVSAGLERGAGGAAGRDGMNLFQFLVNQMRRRSIDQSSPHSARSADVSRRQVRLPGVRGAKDRYCLHAGSRWDSAIWKVGLDLPDR
jgi:hypothetical protein